MKSIKIMGNNPQALATHVASDFGDYDEINKDYGK